MHEILEKSRAHKEQIRRQKIGELVEELTAALPKHLVCKNSRQTDVLTAAIKYIKECQSTEQTLVDSEIDSNCAKYAAKIKALEQYIAELESRCYRYAKLLDTNGICRSLRTETKVINKTKEKVEKSPSSDINSVRVTGNENNVTACIGAPVILLVQQRIGGGRRKRLQSQFPTAFKVPPLLPKPVQLSSDDKLTDFVVEPQQLAPPGQEMPMQDIVQPSNSVVVDLVGPFQNEFIDEQPVVVNIDAPPYESDPVQIKPLEDAAVETEPFIITTCETESQTDPVPDEPIQKFVDRALSPCIFEEVQTVVVKPTKQSNDQNNAKYSQRKKQKTDAISEIVNFIVDMPRKNVTNNHNNNNNLTDPASTQTVNKPVERADVVCTPSVLRVVDMLQPMAATNHSIGNHSNSTSTNVSRPVHYANKRTTGVKQPVKRTESIEKHLLPSISSSTSSWREFLPNFSQVFPSSYCPPPTSSSSTSSSKMMYPAADTHVLSSKQAPILQKSSVGNNFHHNPADFSIESLRSGLEPTKTSRSSSQHNQKISATKLSHFPCNTNNTTSASSCSVPTIPYNEMPVFLPCFPHPPPSTLQQESKNKSKRSTDVLTMSVANNPLIPTDGSQEVNLSNSIFDMQGNTAVSCGSFMPTYHSTGQSVNFYNFSTNKTATTIPVSADERNSDHPVAWQWSDHGFPTQTYTHPTDGIQSSGQKVQNFHIASMFPEVTTPLSNSAASHMSPSYRWNEPPRLSNEQIIVNTTASMPGHHYSVHEPTAWALPQLRTYSSQERSSNSFMPSFNFSQLNSHT